MKNLRLSKNNRFRKLLNSIKTVFNDYSEHSTIHGINYIIEKDRSWFERLCWILIVCVSVFCCGKLIFDARNINPIRISFSDKPTPIWQVCSCATLKTRRFLIFLIYFLQDSFPSYGFMSYNIHPNIEIQHHQRT
jgi:Amiloride-sensitive sodium channel